MQIRIPTHRKRNRPATPGLMPFPGLTQTHCKRSWPSRGTANLRLAADFDNFRKRIARETERSAAAQKEAFIRELLPVIDNLERALGSDVSTSPEQLTQLLRRHGIEPEESLGRPFDPPYHEAASVR